MQSHVTGLGRACVSNGLLTFNLEPRIEGS